MVSHRVPYAVVGGGLVALLAGLRVLSPAAAFAGFGSELVLLVGGTMVLGAALARTGVTERLVGLVQLAAGAGTGPAGERRLLAVLVLAAALTGAVLGDVSAMALWLPAVVQLARRHATTPGRLLLPVLFGVMAGSQLTLIGTAGNILASGLLAAAGHTAFGLFSQAPVGLVLVVLAVLLAVGPGPHLLPPRGAQGQPEVDFANLKMYQGEVVLAEHPAVHGRRLRDAVALRDGGLRVAAVLDAAEQEAVRPAGPWPGILDPDTVLRAGDRLLVQGSAEDLLRADAAGLFRLFRETEPAAVTAEALILPDSGLQGHTVAELSFRQRYGLEVLAVWRHLGPPPTRLPRLRLRAGDILLLAGPRGAALRLHERLDALLLGERSPVEPRRHRAPWALAILAGFVIAAASGAVDPAVAALGAAALTVLTGCLRADEALAALDLPILVLLAGIVPLGTALQHTAVPAAAAALLTPLARAHGPFAAWTLLFLAAAVTTQFLSDVATALLWVPVAVHVAAALHLDPRPLVLAVMVGGQVPVAAVGHKVALLLPTAGGYTQRDFLRYGLPAAAVFLAGALLVAPRFFPWR